MDVRETFKLKGIFNSSPLIYTDAHDWEKLVNVFRENPEDIPGVRLIHPEALNLATVSYTHLTLPTIYSV